MRVIVAELTGFTATYPVYYVDTEKAYEEQLGRVGIPNFGETVVNYCNQMNCDQVNICGDSRFTINCAKEILTVAKTKYNQNNIKVEVNGNEIFA